MKAESLVSNGMRRVVVNAAGGKSKQQVVSGSKCAEQVTVCQ